MLMTDVFSLPGAAPLVLGSSFQYWIATTHSRKVSKTIPFLKRHKCQTTLRFYPFLQHRQKLHRNFINDTELTSNEKVPHLPTNDNVGISDTWRWLHSLKTCNAWHHFKHISNALFTITPIFCNCFLYNTHSCIIANGSACDLQMQKQRKTKRGLQCPTPLRTYSFLQYCKKQHRTFIKDTELTTKDADLCPIHAQKGASWLIIVGWETNTFETHFQAKNYRNDPWKYSLKGLW